MDETDLRASRNRAGPPELGDNLCTDDVYDGVELLIDIELELELGRTTWLVPLF